MQTARWEPRQKPRLKRGQLERRKMSQFRAQLEGSARRLAKTVKLPGFRPGKVPLGAVARSTFGAFVISDAVQKFLRRGSRTESQGCRVSAHQLAARTGPRAGARILGRVRGLSR
jgi:hypothetical protein